MRRCCTDTSSFPFAINPSSPSPFDDHPTCSTLPNSLPTPTTHLFLFIPLPPPAPRRIWSNTSSPDENPAPCARGVSIIPVPGPPDDPPAEDDEVGPSSIEVERDEREVW